MLNELGLSVQIFDREICEITRKKTWVDASFLNHGKHGKDGRAWVDCAVLITLRGKGAKLKSMIRLPSPAHAMQGSISPPPSRC